MKNIILTLIFLFNLTMSFGQSLSTTPASTPIILGLCQDKTTGCKFYTYNSENRYGTWSGTCKNGLIDGAGMLRLFEGDSLILISNCTYIGGYKNGESIDSFMDGTLYHGNFVNGLREGKGKMVFPDGQFYEGDWKNGEYEGKGKFVSSDGGYYDGEWKNGEMAGKGKNVMSDGRIYDGDWKNGKHNGLGFFSQKNKKTYFGEWKDDSPEGNGRMVLLSPVPDLDSMILDGIFRDGKMIKGKEIWYSKDIKLNGTTYEGEGVFMGPRSGIFTEYNPNGQVFIGEYQNGYKYKGKTTHTSGDIHDGELNKDGSAVGEGTYYWKDGQRYNGEFKEGKINGQGTMTYTNGESYQGDWKNGEKEGKGKMVYSTGNYYEGDWKHDIREGKGKMVYSDGNSYEGDWKNNTIEGKGKYVFSSGNYYVGDFKNGMSEGKGKMVYSDGDSYDGDWKNDKYEGKGKYIYSNGDSYDGEWKNDKKEGKGTYTFSDGSKQTGIFESGKLVTRDVSSTTKLTFTERLFATLSPSENQYVENLLQSEDDPKGIVGDKCGTAYSKCKWCGKLISFNKVWSSRIASIKSFKDPLIGGFADVLVTFASSLTGEDPIVKYSKDLKADLMKIKSGNIYFCSEPTAPKFCSEKCKTEYGYHH